jgi:hypothetical protein
MFQDHAAVRALQNELISPAPVLRLAPNEAPAPIAELSLAKRNALPACINAGGLYTPGAWHGPCGGRPLSGVTIADLARDGLLTVTTSNRVGSAELTVRGHWFARTLLHDGGMANRELGSEVVRRVTARSRSEWHFALRPRRISRNRLLGRSSRGDLPSKGGSTIGLSGIGLVKPLSMIEANMPLAVRFRHFFYFPCLRTNRLPATTPLAMAL